MKPTLQVFAIHRTGSGRISLVAAHVSAGFPSPADDYIEVALDLHQHLVRHPAATFIVRVQGNSMQGAGIHNGDLLIVDRSLEPRSGSVVVAILAGELTVKTMRRRGDKVVLEPANPGFASIEVGADSDFSVWGVVTHTIHATSPCTR